MSDKDYFLKEGQTTLQRRDFLAKFGAMTVGSLWLPQASGFMEGNEASLTRLADRDIYQATYYSYGRMEYAGPLIAAARKGDGKALAVIDQEIKGFRQDMARWLGQPLGDVWPDGKT